MLLCKVSKSQCYDSYFRHAFINAFNFGNNTFKCTKVKMWLKDFSTEVTAAGPVVTNSQLTTLVQTCLLTGAIFCHVCMFYYCPVTYLLA